MFFSVPSTTLMSLFMLLLNRLQTFRLARGQSPSSNTSNVDARKRQAQYAVVDSASTYMRSGSMGEGRFSSSSDVFVVNRVSSSTGTVRIPPMSQDQIPPQMSEGNIPLQKKSSGCIPLRKSSGCIPLRKSSGCIPLQKSSGCIPLQKSSDNIPLRKWSSPSSCFIPSGRRSLRRLAPSPRTPPRLGPRRPPPLRRSLRERAAN